MTAKKKEQTSFTSFRIIGKKAQALIARARSSRNENGEPKKVAPPTVERPAELLIHVSIGSVVRGAFAILAIVIGTWLVYHLREKLILIFLAIFVATVMDPGVQALQRMRFPRGIAILIHYFFAFFLFFFLLFSLIPIVAIQLQQIATFISHEVDGFLADPRIYLPLIPAELNEKLTILAQTTLQDLSIDRFAENLQQLGQSLSTAAQGSVKFAAQVAGSVVNFFLNMIIVLVLAFFFQLEKEKIVRWSRGFLPMNFRKYMDYKSEAIHFKIGQWARGQLILMCSIGVLTFIALTILGMDYAVTLAVLAGFCELIPVVGPFIAAVPAVLIALTQEGFIWALVLMGVYYVIQWCENNLLVPLIMKRAVGLSPIAILAAMMIGISFPETIHPILGVMLAIPLTTIITLFLEDWRSIQEEEKKQ